MGVNEPGTQREIKERLRHYISENFLMFAGVATFRDSDSFLELGVIDSTGILELLEFVEGTFGIHVEDDETLPANLDSLDNLSAFILRKAGSACGPAQGQTPPRLPSDDVPS